MTKKEKWVDIEVCRVKLEAEQAVLSCCYTPARGAVYSYSGSYTGSPYSYTFQCITSQCGPGGGAWGVVIMEVVVLEAMEFT